MKVEKSIIKSLSEKVIFSGVNNIDNDFILPEYFDNISKILKCTIEPFTENTVVSGDRISINSTAEVSVLYVGEDNKLYNYNTVIKYDKIINSVIETNEPLLIKQSVITLKWRAVAPKKINCKASIEMEAKKYCFNETEIINKINDENCYSKVGNFESFYYTGCYSRDITLDYDHNPESKELNIEAIIRKNADVEIEEIKAIKDKALIKGHIDIEIIYSDYNGNINKLRYKIPFSEVLDLFGISENDIIHISDIQCKNIITCNNENNKSQTINNRVNINLLIKSGINESVTYISDVFATDCETEISTAEISHDEIIKEEVISLSLSDNLRLNDHNDISLVDISIDSLNASYSISDNIPEILINASISAIFKNSLNEYEILTQNMSSRKTLDTMKCQRIEICNIKVLSISALQANRNEFNYTADIIIKTIPAVICKVNCLTDIHRIENTEFVNNSNIILYFALKNENIWDIAKSNKISADSIKKINNIEEDEIKENRILILAE